MHLALMALLAIPCFSQSPKEIEARMDEIKMDASFIYGEAFSLDKDAAYHNAFTELLVYVNELRGERHIHPMDDADLRASAKELRYSKGARYVAFIYVPWKDVLPQKQRKVETAAVSHDAPAQTPDEGEILRTICGQDNWTEIKGFLTAFKKEGKIRETGNCRAAADVPSDAYSILMDDLGGILAVLSPKGQSGRMNCRTNQPDNENNYSNCKFIVWYK